MLWLYLAIAVATIWSFSAFIDNYQTDVVFRKRCPQASKVFDGTTYLVAAVVVFLIFGLVEMPAENIAWIIASGAIAAVSTIPYLLALRDEETTATTLFYQLTPIIYLLVDWLVFGETITPLQLIGFIIILIAPVIVIFSRKQPKSRRMEFGAALLLLVYVLLIAISGLASTHAGAGYTFTTVFFYFLVGRGVTDLFLFFINRKWRERMKYIWRRKRKQYLVPAVINQILTLAAEFMSRYALIIGIASLVSVTYNMLELIFTFLLGIILSIIWPKFGREKLKRHIVIAHLVATILAAIGIILIS